MGKCIEKTENGVIFNGIDSIEYEIQEALQQAYGGNTITNTDIIIEEDGSVKTFDYVGSVSYNDPKICFVYQVSSQDKNNYLSYIREGLTEEQVEFCDKNGWLSIWETNSQNESDWQEFKAEDDDFHDTLSIIKQNAHYDIQEKYRNELI